MKRFKSFLLGINELTVRCFDKYGGYSSRTFNTNIRVTVPKKINTNALNEELDKLAGEQNMGALMALASTFVSTMNSGNVVGIPPEQRALQAAMTSNVIIFSSILVFFV